MKKLFVRRPSPAMIVASVALVTALSGTAVGLPGINKVDSGDIRNNSVKGKDVNEGTLGPVPSAANAANATTAANAASLGGDPASSFAQTSQLAALAQDDQILSLAGGMDVGDPPLVLDVWGPFTFTGLCAEASGVKNAQIDISTSVNNTFVNSQLSTPQDDDDFDVADSPNILVQHVQNADDSSFNPPDIDFWDSEGEFTFISSSAGASTTPDDGVQIGAAVNTEGADCRFFGSAMGPDL